MDFVFADCQSTVQGQYLFTITGLAILSAEQSGTNLANQIILEKGEKFGVTAETNPEPKLSTIILQESQWDAAGEYADYSGSIQDRSRSKMSFIDYGKTEHTR